MRTLTCKSCQGDYHPVQADGSAYYHVCPQYLPSVNNADMVDMKTPVQVAPLPRAAADIRNENVPSTDESSKGKMISAGKDVLVKVP